MPYRIVVSNKLAQLLNVLSHPIRIRIVEELKNKELTVSALKDILDLSPAATSQQLSLLRAHGIVAEKRQGRNVFYHLCKPSLADWLMDGLNLIDPDPGEVQTIATAIESARNAWSGNDKEKKTLTKRTPRKRS